MWGYFGSKLRIAGKYPSPKYGVIIEPFAGSAMYSVLHHDRDVLLIDCYEVVVDIWEYLISASPEQIERLPELKRGDDVRDLDILQVEKDLMGFMVNVGVASPRNICTKRAFEGGSIRRTKQRIIENLDNIRHFKVVKRNYKDVADVEATWFIDPPYQGEGHGYVCHDIDYEKLAEWCKTRKGQVIVCENLGADWLPFRNLIESRGQRKKNMEVIWTNY